MSGRPAGSTAWTGCLFFIGLVVGHHALIRVIGVGFFAPLEETLREAAVWWIGGAAVVSGGTAMFQPRRHVFWSIGGFTVPIIGWCLFFTLGVFGDLKHLLWMLIGLATVASAFLAALIGRKIGAMELR